MSKPVMKNFHQPRSGAFDWFTRGPECYITTDDGEEKPDDDETGPFETHTEEDRDQPHAKQCRHLV